MRISDWSSDVCSSDLISRTPDVCRTLPENYGFERWTTHCPQINGGAFGSACRTFIQARKTPLNCFAIPLLAHHNQVPRRIARAEQSVRQSLGHPPHALGTASSPPRRRPYVQISAAP